MTSPASTASVAPAAAFFGEQLRLLDQLHDEVTERFGERAVRAGEGLDFGIERQHPPPQVEHVVRTGGAGAQQRLQQLLSLSQANRVGNSAHPPLEDSKVSAERVLDPRNLVPGAGTRELIEQQADLGRAQPQLEHAFHQEHIHFIQPVERVQAFLDAVLGLHQLVEIGDHRGGAGGRVGNQGFGQVGQPLRCFERLRDGAGQALRWRRSGPQPARSARSGSRAAAPR